MKAVGQPIRKKDAMALVTGKPVFMDDLAPKDCLIVKVLRSPYAHALIEEIDCKVASSKDRCGKKSAGDRRYLHVGRCAA